MQQFPLSMDIVRHPEMKFNNLNPPTQGITHHYGFLLVPGSHTVGVEALPHRNVGRATEADHSSLVISLSVQGELHWHNTTHHVRCKDNKTTEDMQT